MRSTQKAVLLAIVATARAYDTAFGATGGLPLQQTEGHVLQQQGPCHPDDPSCASPPSPPPTPYTTIRTRFTVSGMDSDFNASRTLSIKRLFASILPINVTENYVNSAIGLTLVSTSSSQPSGGGASAYLSLLLMVTEDGSAAQINATIAQVLPDAAAASSLFSVSALSVPTVTQTLGAPLDVTLVTTVAVQSPPPPPNIPPPPFPVLVVGIVGGVSFVLLVLLIVAICLCCSAGQQTSGWWWGSEQGTSTHHQMKDKWAN